MDAITKQAEGVVDNASAEQRSKIEKRVASAAEAALRDRSHIEPIDVLCGMGWLQWTHVQMWRQGRVESLEEMIQVKPEKLAYTMAALRAWAEAKGLIAQEARYVRTGRNGAVELRFSVHGEPDVEAQYRTHYVSPALTEAKREKLQAKLEEAPKALVIQPLKDTACGECGAAIEENSFLMMDGGEPLCLACARLDDLEFLPAGDVALTRRSTKFSAKVATVVRFSRSRKRYERQGILAEPAAIEKAEESCAADAPARAAARARGAEQRRKDDRKLAARMGNEIATLFPGCPEKEAEAIAEHTARRGSGRVGRTEAGRKLDERALTLAVVAAIRHRHTEYDALLAKGVDRERARGMVIGKVEETLAAWRGK